MFVPLIELVRLYLLMQHMRKHFIKKLPLNKVPFSMPFEKNLRRNVYKNESMVINVICSAEILCCLFVCLVNCGYVKVSRNLLLKSKDHQRLQHYISDMFVVQILFLSSSNSNLRQISNLSFLVHERLV